MLLPIGAMPLPLAIYTILLLLIYDIYMIDDIITIDII